MVTTSNKAVPVTDPNQARQIINRYGREHTLVVYAVKKNGQLRRFVCRYYGAGSARPDQMLVWDLDKGRPSTICLDTVTVIAICGVSRPAPKPSKAPGGYSEEFLRAQEAIQALF